MLKYISKIITLLFYINLTALYSQTIQIDKIEPPNWWVGMKHDTVQLMLYGKNLNLKNVESDDLKIINFYNLQNSNYAFIDIVIQQNTKSGNHILILSNNQGKARISFPVYERSMEAKNHKGFSDKDVIYLIMPDRFANADSSNDELANFKDAFEGNPTQGRQGGDLKGIINKLNYIKDLGVSAIWMTPLIENNTDRSYHGYATTNFYSIDPRFGSLSDYIELVKKAHRLGLKVIYDHVSNHISIDHPWMNDLPQRNWINGSKRNHLNANHNKMAFTDIHSDSTTINQITNGWFVDIMPDLNQLNSYLANYLIQNLIWWIETAGIDGVREDTYPYVDANFSARLSKEIIAEYPNLNIVGEVWTGEPAYLAGFQKNSKVRNGFNTNLPCVTDFALRDAFYHFLKGSSIFEIYRTIAMDNLYPDPNNLMVFIDNHDIERTMFVANENLNQAKLAYLMLLTLRGIPQLLYGSEIGMVGTQDQGTLRIPFPGGFPGDSHNAFSASGRNEFENDIFNFLRQIIHLRKLHPALSTGKLSHFPPRDELYIYSKKSNGEKILIIINNNNESKIVNLKDYCPNYESLSFTDLISNRKIALNNKSILKISKKNFLMLKIN